jgi:hypothetical protein
MSTCLVRRSIGIAATFALAAACSSSLSGNSPDGSDGSVVVSEGGSGVSSESGSASAPDGRSVGEAGSSADGTVDTGASLESSADTGPSLEAGVDAAPSSDSSVDAGSRAEGGNGAFQAFPSADCERFHFGTIDSNAKNYPSLTAQLDMFTSGWIGQSTTTFDLGSVCTETDTGGAFYGKVPALVSYVIGFTARDDVADDFCLGDCNAPATAGTGCTTQSDLCTGGAAYIRKAFTTRILPTYAIFAQGFATACGTTRPIIWEMEPDFYQYYDAGQGGDPLTGAEAANYMSQMIATVKKSLPNAVFSMDISPWMSPVNGCTAGGKPGWYSYFDMSQFTFVNTSGGGTLAASANIRAGEATWAGVHQCSGNKPILADTGYGAAGGSAGPDPNWDVPANINARIANGVVSVTQYNPTASTWGATIAANRSMLEPIQCY